MKPLSLSGLGLLCALTASIAFSLNDVGIKFLSGDYPLHQIVLIRASVGLLITLLVMIPLEGGYHLIRTKRLGLHLLRSLFVILANMLFFLGLADIPLSEATAIFFVSPLIITIFSVVFLMEKVGIWRWMAVTAGLIGAVVMLRPTPESFRLAGLLPFGAAICYAGLHVLTRKIGSTEKASTMSFYIQFGFVVTSAGMGLAFGNGWLADQESSALQFLFRPWIMPTSMDFMVMIGIGFASGAGGYFISQAYRLSEAALIAPVEYSALILSIVWGIWIFNEWPDGLAWIGMVLILGGGLLMIWREAVTNKRIISTLPMTAKR